jgi:hypothetical protein
MLKFNSFVSDVVLESLINETFLYFSDDFTDIINGIDSPISVEILSNYDKDIKPDMTFLDVVYDKPGYISFISGSNANKIIRKTYIADDDMVIKASISKLTNDQDADYINSVLQGKEVYTKSRNIVKLGKFINKLTNNKFKDKEVEEFVNKFKASISDVKEEFEIVEGDAIKEWYNYKNYYSDKGTLGSSCMKSVYNNYFDIYSDNPDVCKMLILKRDNKLLGRALIWKLKEINNKKVDDVYFMDRQYTVKDSDVIKFREYAKNKGWYIKSENNHHNLKDVITPNGDVKNLNMVVKVKKTYTYYPYMDTFRLFDPDIYELYNSDDGSFGYILDSTGGDYTDLNGHYSEWFDTMIPEDDAIYSDILEDWIYSDNSIYIPTRDSYVPEYYENMVYDEFRYEYVILDDTIYSEYYGESVYQDDAVKTVTEIYRKGLEVTKNVCSSNDREIVDISNYEWVNLLSEYESEFDYVEYMIGKLLVSDYLNDYIPKLLAVPFYKTKDDRYLSKIDAFLLDKEIETAAKQEFIILNEYLNNIQSVGITENENEKIIKLSKQMVEKLNDMLEGKGQLKINFSEFSDSELEKDKINNMIELFHKRSQYISDRYADYDSNFDFDYDFGRNADFTFLK